MSSKDLLLRNLVNMVGLIDDVVGEFVFELREELSDEQIMRANVALKSALDEISDIHEELPEVT